jgi:hypothetical protein
LSFRLFFHELFGLWALCDSDETVVINTFRLFALVVFLFFLTYLFICLRDVFGELRRLFSQKLGFSVLASVVDTEGDELKISKGKTGEVSSLLGE